MATRCAVSGFGLKGTGGEIDRMAGTGDPNGSKKRDPTSTIASNKDAVRGGSGEPSRIVATAPEEVGMGGKGPPGVVTGEQLVAVWTTEGSLLTREILSV